MVEHMREHSLCTHVPGLPETGVTGAASGLPHRRSTSVSSKADGSIILQGAPLYCERTDQPDWLQTEPGINIPRQPNPSQVQSGDINRYEMNTKCIF